MIGQQRQPLAIIRASAYTGLPAAVWMAECFLFSHFLHFSAPQVVVMAVVYMLLLAGAVCLFIRFARSLPAYDGQLPVWRLLALAPMLVATIGSFLSLILVVLIAALGHAL